MGTKNILADTDYTKGHDNRFQSSVVIARVSKIECDKTQANVRCIMPDRVDHKGEPLITKPIPVLHPAATGKRSFQIPRVGTNVVLVKLPNSTCSYAVLASFYTTSDPPPVTDPKLDYCQYDDGSVMQFNAANGQLDWNLKGDYNYAGEKDFNVKNKGNLGITPEKDVNIKPQGKVLIEASEIKLKGHVVVEGAMDQTGGNHTDPLGHHSSGREAQLEERVAALERRMAQLEARLA